MKNLKTYINEDFSISIDILNEIKEKIENELNNKEFTISCDNFKLNNKFNNRVGGYALESIINQILGDSNEYDAKYKNYNIEIKSIKDAKYSSYDKMFTKNEQSALDSLIVILIDYSQSENKFNINKISICLGSDVKQDKNPSMTCKNAKVYI